MPYSTESLLLCLFSFTAGFIDAVVGGGGLIQVPALFVILPNVPAATLLGTNKFASIWGTLSAAIQYMRRVPVEWPATLAAAAVALPSSYLGARAVTVMQPTLLRPLILALLMLVLLYTLWRKDFGRLHAPRLGHRAQLAGAALCGAILGFYDGFFGPGTGSFLIFAYVAAFGFSFLSASTSAKLINLTTNFAAVLWFVRSGHVLYALAIPMAICNIAGALLGARLALRRGSGFVRLLFIGIVIALICRYGWDLLQTH